MITTPNKQLSRPYTISIGQYFKSSTTSAIWLKIHLVGLGSIDEKKSKLIKI